MNKIVIGSTDRSAKRIEISAAALHIIAMTFMLMDPLGNLASGTGLADLHWKNCISCLCIYDSGRVFSYS